MPAWMTSLLRALVPVPKACCLQHQHLAPLQRQRTGHRQADHAGADHHCIDLIHANVPSTRLLEAFDHVHRVLPSSAAA
jgi:hypothetical protein